MKTGTKNHVRALVVLVILLAVYHAAVFLIPFAKTAVFWLSYVFTLLAFALAAVAVWKGLLAQAGATEDDCEDIASLAGKVAGSRVSVTIREMKPGLSKISLRSGEDFDSAAICALHGGGGHKMAAGCSIKTGPDEARQIIVRAILEAL